MTDRCQVQDHSFTDITFMDITPNGEAHGDIACVYCDANLTFEGRIEDEWEDAE